MCDDHVYFNDNCYKQNCIYMCKNYITYRFIHCIKLSYKWYVSRGSGSSRRYSLRAPVDRRCISACPFNVGMFDTSCLMKCPIEFSVGLVYQMYFLFNDLFVN